MAIDFNYTLSPDEAASFNALQDFAKKISKQNIPITLDFNLGDFGKEVEESLGKIPTSVRRVTEEQLNLIQTQLRNSLNNLVLKAEKGGLQGLIPVDDILKSIEAIGQVGGKVTELSQNAKTIKLDLQQWGQYLSNDLRLLEGVTDATDDLKDKVTEVQKRVANDADLQKRTKDYQKLIDEQVEFIKASREFRTATKQQQTAFKDLAEEAKIYGYNIEGLTKNYEKWNAKLKEQDQLFKDRYADRVTESYEKLGGTIQNLVLRYASLQLVLHQMKKYFQEAIQYTFELDDAYTDVAISMDITRKEFNSWTQDAQEIARANGIATTSVMDMVKIYATAGEDIGKISDKLAGTAMIQNITQWDTEETTAAVNSIVKQYNLLEKEIDGTTGNISNAINYLGDNLIAISNKLEIDNVAGIQEMVSAIDDAGSVVKNAGGSMEWYMGVTGALAEAMNATGSEVGAAMRMIKWKSSPMGT